MKKFDLEAAKKGAPVCTRDGRKARIICFDANNSTPIVALVENIGKDNIYECSKLYHSNGHIYDKGISGTDLMMADIPTIRHEGWVNIRYNVDGRDMTDCYIYHSKEAALCYCSDVHHTVKISWEDEV